MFGFGGIEQNFPGHDEQASAGRVCSSGLI
jgi:hypothetical protein